MPKLRELNIATNAVEVENNDVTDAVHDILQAIGLRPSRSA